MIKITYREPTHAERKEINKMMPGWFSIFLRSTLRFFGLYHTIPNMNHLRVVEVDITNAKTHYSVSKNLEIGVVAATTEDMILIILGECLHDPSKFKIPTDEFEGLDYELHFYTDFVCKFVDYYGWLISIEPRTTASSHFNNVPVEYLSPLCRGEVTLCRLENAAFDEIYQAK